MCTRRRPRKRPSAARRRPMSGSISLPASPTMTVVDLAGAMHEDADLAARLERDAGQRTGQLGRGDVVEGDAAPVEALEGVQRRGGETGGVAVDFDGAVLARGASARGGGFSARGRGGAPRTRPGWRQGSDIGAPHPVRCALKPPPRALEAIRDEGERASGMPVAPRAIRVASDPGRPTLARIATLALPVRVPRRPARVAARAHTPGPWPMGLPSARTPGSGSLHGPPRAGRTIGTARASIPCRGTRACPRLSARCRAAIRFARPRIRGAACGPRGTEGRYRPGRRRRSVAPSRPCTGAVDSRASPARPVPPPYDPRVARAQTWPRRAHVRSARASEGAIRAFSRAHVTSWTFASSRRSAPTRSAMERIASTWSRFAR